MFAGQKQGFLVDRTPQTAKTPSKLAGPSACGKGQRYSESLREANPCARGKHPLADDTKHSDAFNLEAARREVAQLNSEVVEFERSRTQVKAAVTTAVMLDVQARTVFEDLLQWRNHRVEFLGDIGTALRRAVMNSVDVTDSDRTSVLSFFS